jgi:hypothetical protein
MECSRTGSRLSLFTISGVQYWPGPLNDSFEGSSKEGGLSLGERITSLFPEGSVVYACGEASFGLWTTEGIYAVAGVTPRPLEAGSVASLGDVLGRCLGFWNGSCKAVVVPIGSEEESLHELEKALYSYPVRMGSVELLRESLRDGVRCASAGLAVTVEAVEELCTLRS